jgi:acetylornithine deacetylase/succinyl-diaminopimelate desuccinylase-like protein
MSADVSRAGIVARARSIFDSGAYLARLSELVAVPTESQMPNRRSDLHRYCADVLGPMVTAIGFTVQVLDNPAQGRGPVMLASRIEGADLPTVLIYGHGDVVRGMPERWKRGLDPWRVSVDGDRIYGRGTVDNKGQHLVAIDALRALICAQGQLGFNAKILVETGEEVGSPGLRDVLRQHRELCAADVFIGLDGPRQTLSMPEVKLGGRGGVAFDLAVDLRDGSHHSGHWGGVLADPGFILAHALASIVTPKGRILVPGWTPAQVPNSVRQACADIVFEDVPGLPEADPEWGEPGMSKAERIFAWTSVIVLASLTGQPDAPVNAVSGTARARLQVRHTVDVPGASIVPNLRAHLDAQGFQAVAIEPVLERDMFEASRTDPDDPWVRLVVASLTETAGRAPNVIPNSSGSNPSQMFKDELGTPIIWVPNSYAGCHQHGPDEHGLGSLFREGLGFMAGLWWDIAHGKAPRK